MNERFGWTLGAVLGGAAVLGAGAGFVFAPDTAAAGPKVEVYKTASCGCCSDWVAYMKDEGFAVEAQDVEQRALDERKREAGLERSLASCHTAFVGDYVVEGHVPAREIRQLLDEEPDIAGLSVPAMPVGSPGMEVGEREDPYDVVAFDDSGDTRVFARYGTD